MRRPPDRSRAAPAIPVTTTPALTALTAPVPSPRAPPIDAASRGSRPRPSRARASDARRPPPPPRRARAHPRPSRGPPPPPVRGRSRPASTACAQGDHAASDERPTAPAPVGRAPAPTIDDARPRREDRAARCPPTRTPHARDTASDDASATVPATTTRCCRPEPARRASRDRMASRDARPAFETTRHASPAPACARRHQRRTRGECNHRPRAPARCRVYH